MRWVRGSAERRRGRGGLLGCQRTQAGRSGQRGGEGAQPGERGDEVVGPRPGSVDPQPRPAAVAGEAGRHVQQPVTDGLGFGDRERAVQAQRGEEGQQVRRQRRQLHPHRVDGVVGRRQLAPAGVFEVADALFDAGVAAVTQIQHLQVGGRLVGEKAGEEVAVDIVEGLLRAGVQRLAAYQQPRPVSVSVPLCKGLTSRS